MRPLKLPVDAALAVTYNCNARCVMCNIWREKSLEGQLQAEDYERLPASLRYINITGGEPFLREDLPEIIRVVKKSCPQSQVIISTNGFLPERIYDLMKRVYKLDPQIGIGFSVDGIGDMHDRIRGVKGAYQRVMQSLERIQEIGVKNIRLGFTASRENVGHFGQVYRLANSKGVQFSCAVAQDSSHYFKTENNVTVDKDRLRQELEYIMTCELKSFSPKRWLRAFFAQGLYGFACGNGRLLHCQAGSEFFFMNPYGDVYPCNVLDGVMGNIREFSFEELWDDERAERTREVVRGCRRKCWMICTARTAIRENKGKAIAWVLRNKAKSHLGMSIN
jgi:radical SAM protein with 4Fe4S-binding SPASM domain